MLAIQGGYKQPIEIANLEDFKMVARIMWREKNAQPILSFLADMFGVEVPKIVVDARYENCYDHTTQTIYIDKYSVVSLLHEFWHHARHVLGLSNTEPDARTFSVSLYAKAFPKLYEKMVAEGRLIWY